MLLFLYFNFGNSWNKRDGQMSSVGRHTTQIQTYEYMWSADTVIQVLFVPSIVFRINALNDSFAT